MPLCGRTEDTLTLRSLISEGQMVKENHDKRDVLKTLLDSLGGRYSIQLGIALSHADQGEIFKWFLASKLLAARISSSIAVKTYREFENSGVLTPWKIRETGWDGLVKILDDGGYARYDFSTATKLLEITRDFIEEYSGDLNTLYSVSTDEEDLDRRLKGLGKGIGDVTVNVFLRELRDVWKKADPPLSPLAVIASSRLGLTKDGEHHLNVLKGIWAQANIKNATFPDFEAALVRLGKDFCKKGKCAACPMKRHCCFFKSPVK